MIVLDITDNAMNTKCSRRLTKIKKPFSMITELSNLLYTTESAV